MNKISKKLAYEISYYTRSYLFAPEFLSLLITEQCNFKCKSCSIWQNKSAETLKEGDCQQIISEIKKIFPKETFIEINGGEPLLKKELLYKVITELKNSYTNVGINTNGSLLSDEVIEKLESLNTSFIKISLYGLTKDIHDNLRGYPGSHEKSINAIKKLSKSKIKTEVGILITNENIHEIPLLIEHLITINNKISIILQPIDEIIESTHSKNRTMNFLPSALWPSNIETETLFSSLEKMQCPNIKNSSLNLNLLKTYYNNPQKILNLRCFAGQRSLVIHPNGNIALCFKGKTIGNILQTPLKTLLKKHATKERAKISACKKYCRIVGCNFSRGINELFHLPKK